ncbi:MAG: LacI family DNA-binding transcriptional regulator [Verrucomicrobia bacterium]|nr:LacI family DNA-binding transcriptional regulator [Verrucomicrobiota bacterium]MCH8510676.1 LacI family transcriptional regulator [Kiritimatiellia bacterium]
MEEKNTVSGDRIDQSENGRVTIFDVAEKAGVSFVSVSRVFNEHPNVSLKMREKVLQAAREMGYQPRLVCKHNLIAVLMNSREALTGRCDKSHLCGKIFQAAARRNFLMEVITLDRLDMLTQHLVDGVIELDPHANALHKFPELLHVPMVLTHGQADQPLWASVMIDYDHEGEMGIASLVSKGHKKIAVLVESMKLVSTMQRIRGIRKFLRNKSIPLDDVTFLDLEIHDIPKACEQVRTGAHTGLLNLSNEHTPTLVDHLFNVLKMDLPKALSLVTLDNTCFSEHYHPRISSIIQPLDELAETAMGELENLIQNRTTQRNILLKSRYHERNTCRKPTLSG